MRRILSLGLAAGLAATFFACATGTSTIVDEGEEGTDSGGRSLYVPEADGGGATERDSSTATTKDSGTAKDSSTGADTGTTTPPASAADCTGTTSSQLGDTYENACDNYYFNSFGGGNPCTPGGNDCAALNSSTYTFCCYKPLPTSGSGYCYDDYGGQAQCLPK